MSIIITSMPSIVIVEKSGTLKSLSVKIYNEMELYKKAGFKSSEGFKCFHTWNIIIVGKTYNISLYGKISGKANQENKYEFPPPIDNTLFFNNCVLVNKDPDTQEVINLAVPEWESIYDHLFGGFEDLEYADSENDESTDDNEELDPTKLTTAGYIKDDFVVDDDDIDEEEESEETDEDADEEDDSVEFKKKKIIKKSVKNRKPLAKKPNTPLSLNIFDPVDTEYNYLGCTSELTEDEYI